ncbi:MAG: hypothetical protein LUI60_06985 [Clostridia bacterium]|nr:hypothetical protein [Clostridia bacterium]
MAKDGGGGKALTGVLCFILGFIIGIAAELAVIVAGVYWLLNTNINNIFSIAGIENSTTDDEGNVSYIYVNTSEVSSIYQLISALGDLYGMGTDALTLNDLENILPITDTVVDAVYSAVSGILGDGFSDEDVYELMDKETLKSTTIANLGTYVKDCLLSMQVDKALSVAGIDVTTNSLYMALAYGSEAGTVTINGEIKILYSVTLTVADTEEDNGEQNGEQNQAAAYKLTDEQVTEGGTEEEQEPVYYLSDGTQLNTSYNDYISSLSGYKLYYYVAEDGKAYVAQRNEYGSEENYSLVYDDAGELIEYTQYDSQSATISGGYYYDENGELVILTYKTLNNITSDGIDSIYDDVYITDMMGEDSDEVLLKALYGITLGSLMNGDTSMDDIMDRINIPDMMDTAIDNAIMAFISYGLTDIVDITVTDETTGDVTYGTVTDTAGTELTYSYTATINVFDEDTTTAYSAYVTTDESGNISAVWYLVDGVLTEYEGVSVGSIDTQIDQLMDTLKIGDMIDTTGSTVLEAIANSTINSLSEDIQNLTLQELFYDLIYDEVFVYDGLEDGKITLTDGTVVEVEEYLKIVYESLENKGGTYYIAESRTYDTTVTVDDGQGGYESKTVTVTEITITQQSYSYGDSDLVNYFGKTDEKTEDISGTQTTVYYEYAVYWSEDGTTLYEVLKQDFNAMYLYLTDGDDGVEYVQYNYEYVYDDNGDIVYDSETGEAVKGEVILGRLTDFSQFTGDGLLYTYGSATGAWYFMLCTADSSGDKYESTYTIDDMGTLMSNTTNNIETATLNELVENDMLTSPTVAESLATVKLKGSVLNKILGITTYVDNTDYELGVLTLSQAMDVFVYMVKNDDVMTALNNSLSGN